MPRRFLLAATVLVAATSSIYAQDSGVVQRWPTQAAPAPRAEAPAPRVAQPREAAPAPVATEAQRPAATAVAEQRRSPGQGDRGNNQGGGGRGNDGSRVAVPRPPGSAPAPRRPGGGSVYVGPRPFVRPYYYARPFYPYGYGAFGGLGYFYYDPYTWYPGGGVRYFDGGYYGRGYGYDTGEVRLRVTPRNAQVFVDGYYTGVVDDYDGALQALRLESGPYHVEIKAPGYDTLGVDLRITPGNKITYRGDLRPTP